MKYEFLASVNYPFRIEAKNADEANKFGEELLRDGALFTKLIVDELAMSSYDIDFDGSCDMDCVAEFSADFVEKTIYEKEKQREDELFADNFAKEIGQDGRLFFDEYTEEVIRIYYNPDSTYGQFVKERYDCRDIIEAIWNINSEDWWNDLWDKRQPDLLYDRGTPEFLDFARQWDEASKCIDVIHFDNPTPEDCLYFASRSKLFQRVLSNISRCTDYEVYNRM
jgi:hypothetical protein